MEPMELNPLDELEVLRAEVQDLLQAELARGVAMAPRPERAEFEPAAGAPAAGPAAARPERSQPATRPAPRPSSRSGSPARSEPKAVVASKAKGTPARSGKSKWGGSPSSPKRPDPPPAPPQAAPPNMGMEGPPPPEAPDWIVEEEASGPPPDLGIPLPPPPKVYKRPKKREIAYTYNHVVGTWGFGKRPLPPLPPGSPARTSADQLLASRKELGECERCGLCERSSHIVYGMGNPGADLVIVGEGPGEDEDRQGLPFIGPAGQMLDRMLQGVLGLDRQKVYILNVVKCRPPRNRAPTPEEVGACRPFLEAQLRAIQPKVILALGGSASQALLGSKEGIMKLRGDWHAWEGIPLRPTVHPAYLLRRPQDKRLAMEDLVALRARYQELGGLQ